MQFLEKISSLSFGKIISIAVFIAIAFAVPLTVMLTQQQTKIGSKAYQKPQMVLFKENVLPGPVPKDPPQIGRVYPWLGKAGDIVWIQGKNFGNNPARKSLTISGVLVPDDQIYSWRDGEIQAYIPLGAQQAKNVEIKIGDHPMMTSLPIVLYNKDTKTKVIKRASILSLQNGADVVKAQVWTGDENTPSKMTEVTLDASLGNEVNILDIGDAPLLSIYLYNKDGAFLPYYVNPVDFGF